MNQRVAVIGAGPAGITAAYVLAKSGIPVDVYEASNQVGGLAKTISLWGQKVDLGPHRFFSSDPRVNRLWLEVAGQDYRMVNRLTRIYYRGKFYHYPLKPWNAFCNLGVWETKRCLASYLKQHLRPEPLPESLHDNFEHWVVSRFGRRLFEIFFKTYSEKLWGIACTELDSDFAAQRIKKLSLGEAIKNAFGSTKKMHKTLVDEFAYPIHGTGSIYDRMAEKVRTAGGNIFFNRPVARVLHEDSKVTGVSLEDETEHDYRAVISSMPLTLMVSALGNLPQEVREATTKLTYRNTILVYLNVAEKNLFSDNWLYIHSPDLKVGRITNFRNWVPGLYGRADSSILCLEYWANDEEALWNEDDTTLIERAKKELRSTGLIGEAAILEGSVRRLKRCYPVYRCGYKEPLSVLMKYLSRFSNLQVVGRYGAFKYNNQDHSILMGLMAAENLAAGTQHDLWSINTDYEYQEAAVITETGLKQIS